MGLFKMIFDDRKDIRDTKLEEKRIESQTKVQINGQDRDADIKIHGIENAADILDAVGRLLEKLKKE